MKMSLTNTMVKQIVQAVRDNKLRYAIGGIYENILIITCDGAAIYRAEVNSDFTDYIKKVKQPAADFIAMTHLIESMDKYICRAYQYDEFIEIMHHGQKHKQIEYNGKKYLFDGRYLTQFKSGKKYQLNLFIYSDFHGLVVKEYLPHDDIFDTVAVIMGVRS